MAARGSWCWWYGEEDGGDGGKERKLLDLGSGEGDHPRGREIPPLPPPHKDLKPWGRKGGGRVGAAVRVSGREEQEK